MALTVSAPQRRHPRNRKAQEGRHRSVPPAEIQARLFGPAL